MLRHGAWLMCLAAPYAVAAALPSQSLAPATVVLAGDRNYAPYQFSNEDGDASGFDVELFRAVAAEAGLPMEVQLGNWNDNLKKLQSGAVDVMPMFISPERAKKFLFTTPFLRRYHLVFGRRDQAYVASIDALAGHRVAVQFAGLAWERLVSMGNVIIVPTDVESAALDVVRSGRADYALVPMNIGYAKIMQHQGGDMVALSPPLLENAYAFAVTPLRPQLVGRINSALQQVQASGLRDRIYLEWLANMRPPEVSYRHGLLTGAAIALPLLVLCLGALLWLRRSRRDAAAESRRRRELEDRAEHLAFHDADTGLPNSNGLMRILHQCVRDRIHDGGRFAVVRVDLADLDTLRAVGGDVMERVVRRTIATRLAQEFPRTSVGLVGHGAFALVVPATDSVEAAMSLMAAIMKSVQKRITIDDLPLEQRCRAGLAVYPDHGDNAEAVLRAASMACAAAQSKRAGSMLYAQTLEPDPRNLTLLTELHEAIAAGSLGYALQPKLDLRSRRIIGAEMLVRWQHDRHGALAPAEFIPLAERTGVIGAMTEYLVKRAIAHCHDWHAQGSDMSLSVNVSVNDLADHALVASIIHAVRAADCKLILEVTESDLMRDSEDVLAAVRQLRAHGVGISLDDFGTGYSSLTYLKRMAPDELKIDRSFVRDVLHSPSDQTIVRASIDLAHSLGASVTAEGIENDATLEWLAGIGCDEAQGNAIAKPMPADELVPWARGRSGNDVRATS